MSENTEQTHVLFSPTGSGKLAFTLFHPALEMVRIQFTCSGIDPADCFYIGGLKPVCPVWVEEVMIPVDKPTAMSIPMAREVWRTLVETHDWRAE
jgi:hypothetical protein